MASSPLLLEFCQIRYALIGSADRGPLHRRVRRASSYEQVAVLLPPHLLTFRVRDGPNSLESRTGVHDMLPVDYYRQVEERQDRNEFVMILQPSQPMQKVRMRSVVNQEERYMKLTAMDILIIPSRRLGGPRRGSG